MKKQCRALYVAIKVGEQEFHLTKTGRIIFPEGGGLPSDVLSILLDFEGLWVDFMVDLENRLLTQDWFEEAVEDVRIVPPDPTTRINESFDPLEKDHD